MNIKNFKKVLNRIKKHPETWDQGVWINSCGTKFCFAGHARNLLRKKEPANCITTLTDDAICFLEATTKEAYWLFQSLRTIKDFEFFLDYYTKNNNANFDEFIKAWSNRLLSS